jgi:hypothetical protein
MVFLTIDKAAHLGRAIDPDLNNPITYREMTGSTSGSPINILRGLNDFAIGTDGGGSCTYELSIAFCNRSWACM